MGLLKKQKSFEIGSPLVGKTLPISRVPDQTFSTEILGKGVAISPLEGNVYAPCDATVDLLLDTAHAVNLITKNGVELLIHIGIDTVKLKGKHFTAHVKNGDVVKQGDLLISFNQEAIEKEGYPSVVPVVVCGMGEFTCVTAVTDKQVKAGDTILILSK